MSGKELLNFKHKHGLFAKKLTTNDIREIRRLGEEENLSLREISKRFDSNQGVISRIVNYKTYTKVK